MSSGRLRPERSRPRVVHPVRLPVTLCPRRLDRVGCLLGGGLGPLVSDRFCPTVFSAKRLIFANGQIGLVEIGRRIYPLGHK